MNLFSKLFGRKPKTDFKELLKQGALLIDVRSPSEYAAGHIHSATNIPLDTFKEGISELSKQKPIVLYCASGMRSGSAQSYLKKQGYTAYNGGGWKSLKKQLD